MFDAHKEGGLIGTHAPPFRKISTIIRQSKIYKTNHKRLNRLKGKI
jgi:hypothetical protein